jgi:hypothetical protein
LIIDATRENLNDVWDRIVYETGDQSHVSLGEFYETLGDRVYGLMLLLPALIAASPLGLIPGVPLLAALSIIVVAMQAVLGRPSPWAPSWLLDLSIPRKRMESADNKLRPWLARFAKFIWPRVSTLVSPPMSQNVAGFCALLAISFYPLSLIPFAVAGPAGAIALFALGLTARDGVSVIAGFLATATTIAVAIMLWP